MSAHCVSATVLNITVTQDLACPRQEPPATCGYWHSVSYHTPPKLNAQDPHEADGYLMEQQKKCKGKDLPKSSVWAFSTSVGSEVSSSLRMGAVLCVLVHSNHRPCLCGLFWLGIMAQSQEMSIWMVLSRFSKHSGYGVHRLYLYVQVLIDLGRI